MIPGRQVALLQSFLFGGWMFFANLYSVTVTGQGPDTLLRKEGLFRKDMVAMIRSIDVGDTDFSDLRELKSAIGNSRIVLLGEQTHGEGSTFLAKTRLIKMLHEQMGFEVLAFESGLYDCARIWENMQQGGQLSKEAIGSLFYMYATSRQMLPLFGYIQGEMSGSRPLVLTGFESQHTGRKAITDLFGELASFLKAGYPEKGHFGMADSNWSVFRRLSLAMFASRDFRPAEKEKKTFFNELSLLKGLLREERSPVGRLTASAGFWHQVIGSIESQALRYWQLTTSNEMAVRDRQMAENLIWLAEKAYPGKKIIVWAHNVHIARSVPWSERPLKPMAGDADVFIPMGVTIHDHFGASAYCIGFSGHDGSYMNYINDTIVTVNPAPANSPEGRLAAAGYQYAFVNYRLRTGWMEQKQPGGFADYQWINGIWPDIFDGLLYIKTAFPVDRIENRAGN